MSIQNNNCFYVNFSAILANLFIFGHFILQKVSISEKINSDINKDVGIFLSDDLELNFSISYQECIRSIRSPRKKKRRPPYKDLYNLHWVHVPKVSIYIAYLIH